MRLFSLGGKSPEDKTPREGDRRKAGSEADYKGKERRQDADRRGLAYGLRFKTERAVGPIEDWLQENMPNLHRITIEDMSDDFYTKELRAVFASEDLRETFKAALGTYIRTGEFM
ncbi:MAG: hypothetical protein ACFE0S_00455 [Rhodospirillales bacterium]